ncbi:pentatricopeptide repeat domain-containing protein [Hirsutella rhossiliensis]|uniref:Pentatricopeptide repeat domain-containing protein n=1 Tax=Hirsutella rhossiliensis TaxID=111463 RepID=A0A9P8N4Y2_9HYPO|nr:pentatricopeptide repeat domain-containing protein [Hirsutella rhossiliensis]KAH0966879.1 pentatricopeptide repeat domain-containing protein [Hirsutella rhossiliensis]
MQALWSRAGQSHRCGCRPCNIALAAARRRAATAARRRKPTFAELFTACYSSVFATAAVVDAIRKEDRRRDLDRLLEEARRDLSDLQDREPFAAPEGDARTPDLSIQQMDALWRCLKTIYKTRPYMKEIHKPATVTASQLFASLRSERYGCPSEETLRAASRTDYEELEKAVLADESDETLLSREALNKVQLLRESTSVKHLVNKFLARTLKVDKQPGTTPSFEEACILAKTSQTTYTFRSIDSEWAKRNTVLLNRQLRSIMNNPDLRVKEKMGRVCYNLLISAHAADMHTYNTLIVAFDKAGLHGFADALVHSFFHERLLRPTPSTFVAILNHYKVTRNHGRFLYALACITGVDCRTGGKLRRRHVEDVERSPMLLDWALDVRLRTLSGSWVWEHVPPTRALVEEAIYGLLHFKLFEQAASFFLTCVRWGVGLSTKVVKQVLDECVVAMDWKGALQLIRGLMTCKKQWKVMLLTGDGATDWYLISRIYALLDLCGLRSPGGRVSAACLANLDISGSELGGLMEALEEQVSELDRMCLPAADAPATKAVKGGQEGACPKTRLMQIESVWKDYVYVRKTTSSIESKLLKPDFSIEFRTSMALHIGNAAVQRAIQLRQETEQLVGTATFQSPGWQGFRQGAAVGSVPKRKRGSVGSTGEGSEAWKLQPDMTKPKPRMHEVEVSPASISEVLTRQRARA